MRNMYHVVPIVMPSLFEAFTNEDIENKIHAREQILHLFYLLIRLVAWADGIDNELVQSCLGETFQSWMVLFLQLIQSNPKKYFNMKKNVLKCLVVILPRLHQLLEGQHQPHFEAGLEAFEFAPARLHRSCGVQSDASGG